MPTVLALDLAKNSGWAVVSDDGVLACGSWSLLDGLKTSGKGATPLDVQHVLQMQRLRSGVDMLCRQHDVDVVAIEREFGRGSGTRLLVSLFAAAQEAAFVAGLPTLSITVGQWRKGLYGSAKGDTDFFKAKAVDYCANAGIDAPDADAAEAVQIARYAHQCAVFRPAAPESLLKRAAKAILRRAA